MLLEWSGQEGLSEETLELSPAIVFTTTNFGE